MNLDELRAVQSKERGTDSLQHLRESFYADAADYVAELEAERDRRADAAEDPFADPAVRRLTDEVETAREVVEAIYERRLGKLVKRASLAAADVPADDDGLTAEERELFEDLVDRIESNKGRVLDVLDGDAAPADEAAGDATSSERAATADDGHRAAADEPQGSAGDDRPAHDEQGSPAGDRSTRRGDELSGGDGDGSGHGANGPDRGASRGTAAAEGVARPDPEPDGGAASGDTGRAAAGASGSSSSGGERTTVRVTADVDEFFGVDERTYDLDPETVVTLPAENAEPLLRAGDAERVD